MAIRKTHDLWEYHLYMCIIQFTNSCFGWIKVSQELFYVGQHFGVDFGADTGHANICLSWAWWATPCVTINSQADTCPFPRLWYNSAS
jgi:hypothetical protein